MTESCKTHTLDFFLSRKAKFQLICMEPSQKWYIYMRNQKLETELVYKSAKCNTLRQCGAMTDLDLPHFIHNQHGVLFVAHKAITVRTSKISSCLSHISSCKIRSQQVFRGREEKSQQRGNTLHTLWCAKKPIENRHNSILIFKKNIHLAKKKKLNVSQALPHLFQMPLICLFFRL